MSPKPSSAHGPGVAMAVPDAVQQESKSVPTSTGDLESSITFDKAAFVSPPGIDVVTLFSVPGTGDYRPGANGLLSQPTSRAPILMHSGQSMYRNRWSASPGEIQTRVVSQVSFPCPISSNIRRQLTNDKVPDYIKYYEVTYDDKLVVPKMEADRIIMYYRDRERQWFIKSTSDFADIRQLDERVEELEKELKNEKSSKDEDDQIEQLKKELEEIKIGKGKGVEDPSAHLSVCGSSRNADSLEPASVRPHQSLGENHSGDSLVRTLQEIQVKVRTTQGMALIQNPGTSEGQLPKALSFLDEALTLAGPTKTIAEGRSRSQDESAYLVGIAHLWKGKVFVKGRAFKRAAKEFQKAQVSLVLRRGHETTKANGEEEREAVAGLVESCKRRVAAVGYSEGLIWGETVEETGGLSPVTE
jgi:hypothetical protein